jgi:carboxypeptidase Taq
MNKSYRECLNAMKDAALVGAAAGLAGWDQETIMPEAAAESRAEQLAALSGTIHEKITDPGLGRKLKGLKKNPAGLTSDERACVREWLRDHEQAVKLPEALVREMARVATLAQKAWIEARKASSFRMFAPWLEKTIELKRREAKALGYKGIPYDALLDTYEPYMTAAELDPIMDELREGLVPIIRAIRGSKRKPSEKVLTRQYPEADQEALCREVMDAIGVDHEASRLDRSAHPFCCGMAPTDVRITTRFAKQWLPQALYGVIHESGHALYEQGLLFKHYGDPLGEAVSLGIHESQSRMWENLIGRSRPFVDFLMPRLRRRFKGQMKGVSAGEFYRALNRVKATPIRVEADEVTYNLHILLRYEIEKGLIDGSIRVKELPKLWNERMRHYLGITPKDDAHGVLQDTHWASGLVGYFPTYLLGNLYASQLWDRLRRDVSSVDLRISRGDFAPILSWLRRKIHVHGRRYTPTELIRRATAKAPSAVHFLDYLKRKYGEIYRIQNW